MGQEFAYAQMVPERELIAEQLHPRRVGKGGTGKGQRHGQG